MNSPAGPNWIAVDVGNSRIKIGSFASARGTSVPEPSAVFDLPITDKRGEFDWAELHQWCDSHVKYPVEWFVASVCENAKDQLIEALDDWTTSSRIRIGVRVLGHRDVPLVVRVDEPARVGMDRLVGAVAANRLRQRERPAIVVDLGTAITVDLVEADGAFAGGAILPGIGTSAKALHDHTAALPQFAVERLQSPPGVPGKSTTAAIEAGLYWGAVGAIRELVSQMSAKLPSTPELFITGGGAWPIAALLTSSADRPIHHVPNLVLSGVVIVAEQLSARL